MEKNDLQGGMGGRATTQGFQEVFLEIFFNICEAPFPPRHHFTTSSFPLSMSR